MDTTDQHPRPDTTAAKLAGLRGINGPELSVTAGNASGVNDGAAALLLASEAAATANGITPLARVVASAAAGVEPRVMGIGPVPAVRKVLGRARLNLEQIDVIELNEAFAAQALAVTRELGLPDDAEDDFFDFAFGRGYTVEDFIDRELTMKVMQDFTNNRSTPEMERLRALNAKRQAFTGAATATPSAGGAPQTASADQQFMDAVAAKAMQKRGLS